MTKPLDTHLSQREAAQPRAARRPRTWLVALLGFGAADLLVLNLWAVPSLLTNTTTTDIRAAQSGDIGAPEARPPAAAIAQRAELAAPAGAPVDAEQHGSPAAQGVAQQPEAVDDAPAGEQGEANDGVQAYQRAAREEGASAHAAPSERSKRSRETHALAPENTEAQPYAAQQRGAAAQPPAAQKGNAARDSEGAAAQPLAAAQQVNAARDSEGAAAQLLAAAQEGNAATHEGAAAQQPAQAEAAEANLAARQQPAAATPPAPAREPDQAAAPAGPSDPAAARADWAARAPRAEAPPGGAPPAPKEVADVPSDPAVARAFAIRAAQRAVRVALQDRSAFPDNGPFDALTVADQPLTQIFFSLGNFALGPNGKQLLERKLPMLTSDQRPILVVGAADPSGPEQVNEKLSDARAQSVAQWLLAHGVDAQRIQTHAIGHEGAVGSTLDRRVDIWLGGSR